jgi:hypothetical protein
MALTFKASGGGDFKSLSAGSYIAVCNMVVDLGLQPGSAAFPAPKHQVYVRFEVPTERVEYEKDGKKISGPIVIGQAFTASMHEKATLRKRLEGWRGRKFTDEEASNFDVSTILGKPCMLSVIENEKGGKIYSNIDGIGQLPKGVPAPSAENKLLYYADEDRSQFDELPEWIRTKIENRVRPKVEHATGVYTNPDNYDYSDEAAAMDSDQVPF